MKMNLENTAATNEVNFVMLNMTANELWESSFVLRGYDSFNGSLNMYALELIIYILPASGMHGISNIN